MLSERAEGLLTELSTARGEALCPRCVCARLACDHWDAMKAIRELIGAGRLLCVFESCPACGERILLARVRHARQSGVPAAPLQHAGAPGMPQTLVRVAALILERPLCIPCISEESGLTSEQAGATLGVIEKTLTLRYDLSGRCQGCDVSGLVVYLSGSEARRREHE